MSTQSLIRVGLKRVSTETAHSKVHLLFCSEAHTDYLLLLLAAYYMLHRDARSVIVGSARVGGCKPPIPMRWWCMQLWCMRWWRVTDQFSGAKAGLAATG